jgi:hypothetical protein
MNAGRDKDGLGHPRIRRLFIFIFLSCIDKFAYLYSLASNRAA